MRWRMREPVNGLTHLAAALLAAGGLPALVAAGRSSADVWDLFAYVVFGISLILTYTASSLYHLLPLSSQGIRRLRRIDHMMIFVLIAGTYTPFCLIPLRGVWGFRLLVAIWAVALLGMLMKIYWLHAPRWLSTVLYMGLGYMLVVALLPMWEHLPSPAREWILIGGAAYTSGGIIYWARRPNLGKWLGFHEIFHLFAMAGSFALYLTVLRYL